MHSASFSRTTGVPTGLTAASVSTIRSRAARGHKQVDLARKYGVSKATVSRIVNGQDPAVGGRATSPAKSKYGEANALCQRCLGRVRSYHLTPDEFIALWVKHDGKCHICKARPAGRFELHVDHDHKTGRVRGLLCGHCNRGLGHFRDDPLLISTALTYL